MDFPLLIAGLDISGNDIAGMITAGMMLLIPIVAILTSHQQKMAKLMNQQAPPQTNNQDEVLQELRSLRQLVGQQAMILDDVATKQEQLAKRVDQSNNIQARLDA